MRGSGRIRKVLRTVRRIFKPGAVILMYHRVADLQADVYDLAVSPDHFCQHLDYIRRACFPMSLLDLAESIRDGSLPKRSVALTFDDGYHDNFAVAYPLLQAAGIPATVFVASGSVGSSHEFWWDDLERILLAPEGLPTDLELVLDGQIHHWTTVSSDDRARTHRSLHSRLLAMSSGPRDDVLSELASWAGVGHSARPDYGAMAAHELVELARGKLVEVGAHTVHHPVLSSLSVEDQRREILESCRCLESILDSKIRTFAYPFGRAQDFTDATVDIVREAGLCVAVTTIPGSIEVGDEPLRLNRFAVQDWGVDRFAEALESWFVV